ncbi:hypothetical protein Xen7305DRAFT_00048370 [Xenococcus sp. PCC 7305]|uniref:hypothetical protein n=1 Tax=Xenococcus sp. PCC 7305 TaxID=102125 RepID=UPI0002AC2E74|nr:hypothetical protein [Xenococcus sp. PCC 7305]ELS05098.1 hypothetical protein Xen7305DRAFT_00048370 [Xenococcus sp. PCC 7305]
MKIEHLSIINDYLVTVYFTPDLGWRYSVVLHDGSVFQPYDLYQTPQEAYEMINEILDLVIFCDLAPRGTA